jgi:hypothetical protein
MPTEITMEARRPDDGHVPFAVTRDFLGETAIQIDAVRVADRQEPATTMTDESGHLVIWLFDH